MKVIDFLSSFNQSVNKSEGSNQMHVRKIIAETARGMQEEIVEICGNEGKKSLGCSHSPINGPAHALFIWIF